MEEKRERMEEVMEGGKREILVGNNSNKKRTTEQNNEKRWYPTTKDSGKLVQGDKETKERPEVRRKSAE